MAPLREEVTPPENKVVLTNKKVEKDFTRATVAGATEEEKAFYKKHKIDG